MNPLTEPATEWGVVIAACERPPILERVSSVMLPDDLTNAGARMALEFALAATARGEIADKTLVARMLRLEGKTDEAVELFSERYQLSIPEAAPQHAHRLHQLALLRRIRGLGGELHELSESDDPEKALLDAQTILRGASEMLPRSERGPMELVDETLRAIEREDGTHIPTGFPSLDRLLKGGLVGGKLYLVGARTSVGKSMFVTNIARRALDGGRDVLFVSFEMDGPEVLTRMIVERFGISEFDIPARLDAMGSEAVQSWRLRFTDKVTASSLVSRIRDLARDGLDLVVLDYIQLLPTVGRHERRDLELAAASRALKLVALETHVPILMCAQLNRSPEARADRRPRISDLRESGSLEQDADVVILLHRDADAGEVETDLLVGKNRNGPTGIVDLLFQPRQQRFVEEARRL